MNGEGTVYLMDLNGKIVHTWECRIHPDCTAIRPRGNALLEWQDSHRFGSRTDAFKGGVASGRTGKAGFSGTSRGQSSLRWELAEERSRAQWNGARLPRLCGAVSFTDSGWMVGITGINSHEQEEMFDFAVIASSRRSSRRSCVVAKCREKSVGHKSTDGKSRGKACRKLHIASSQAKTDASVRHNAASSSVLWSIAWACSMAFRFISRSGVA